MALNPYEKRSFYRFIVVYLGAGLLVVAAMSFLFYRIDTESIRDRTFADLRMFATQIATSAVDAQMRGTPFKVPDTIGCDYLLLDGRNRPIEGCLTERMDLTRDFYIENGCAYYVDRSAHGHLNIAYIIVRDCRYGEKIAACAERVAMMGLLAYGFIMLVGWYLGRLFLEPMRAKMEAMDRFIKDSTHELNTPVTTMLLALQKIEGKECKPAHLEALQMSGRLIARIYEDLSFMLLRGNELDKAHLKPVDVSSVVKESVLFFSILSERKGIDVTVRTHSCIVEADPHHINLLVKNLLDNAIKYTRRGGRISITLENCVLGVEDTGIGIAEEKLTAIFGRFHRESDVEGGFGIGLSIVDKICNMYGYGLRVTSEEGKGTLFNVDFDTMSQKKPKERG